MSDSFSELFRRIHDKDTIQNDMEEVSQFFTHFLQDRYVSKIQEGLQFHREQAMNQPSKDVVLLRAMKQYASTEQHEDYDTLIDFVTMTDTIRSMEKQYQTLKRKEGGYGAE